MRPIEGEPRSPKDSSEPWFVYLFALADCTAFKVGFTSNPLQRICTFSRRYFEQFDLPQSSLHPLDDCDQARALEAAVKTALAAYRVTPPTWVAPEAGGHTEWFSAVYLQPAAEQCRALTSRGSAETMTAFDYFRRELERTAASFELWSTSQAQQVQQAEDYARRGYVVRDLRRSLCDWLDAYRYFDVPLFTDDASTRAFVQGCARLQAPAPGFAGR